MLPRFGDQAELEEYLIDAALNATRICLASRRGAPCRPGSWSLAGRGPATLPPESDRTHSETNVQVAGVDEGDIIEVDADYVYIVTEDSLVIADAWPAEQLHVASPHELAGRPLVEYLRDDRLTMISDTGVWIDDEEEGEDPRGQRPDDSQVLVAGRDGFGIFPPRGRWVPSVTVTVLDITDRTAPAVVQETRFDGRYVDSRRSTASSIWCLEHPLMLPPPAADLQTIARKRMAERQAQARRRRRRCRTGFVPWLKRAVHVSTRRRRNTSMGAARTWST